MSYIAFARKWRPKDFDGVVGQEMVTTTLKNAIALNRISHAYLFSGPRGVGKTTVARIFAKALNCERGPTEKPCNKCVSCGEIMLGNSVDVLEIDGASNRGIDEIRTLRENIKFSPIAGKFKIYIIDEVHQITQDAFNALLKTLEEPPAHAKFIFATTQPHKVPATIISRCQRFDFKRIPVRLIIEKLNQIVKEEKISAEEEVLFAIARAAEGSMRDAEVLLDQLSCATEGKVKMQDVSEMLGVIEEDLLFDMADKIQKKETSQLLLLLDRIISDGKDLVYLLNSLIEHFRNLLVSGIVKSGLENVLDLPEDVLVRVSRQAEGFSRAEIFYILQILTHTQDMAKRAISVRVAIEMAIIKMTERGQLASINEILNKIEQLKNNLPGEKNTRMPSVQYPNRSEEVKPAAKTVVVPKNELCKEAPRADAEHKEENRKKVSLDEIKAVWQNVIEEVQRHKMHHGLYLSEARLVGIEDNVLTLGFSRDKNLHKETLDNPPNRQTIETRLKSLLKADVRLNFVTIQEAEERVESAVNSEETTGQNNKIDDAPAPDNNVPSDPLAEKLLKIFGGKVIKGEKIDLS